MSLKDFFVTAETDIADEAKVIYTDAKDALVKAEGIIVSDVDPAVTAFASQFTTDLGKSAIKLADNFMEQAKSDFMNAGKALVAAIPAELITDAEDALNVALNALRVKLSAPVAAQ